MLTKEDIEDLKQYSASYDEFCKNRVCDNTCDIYIRSQEQKVSCFKAYCDVQKQSKISS